MQARMTLARYRNDRPLDVPEGVCGDRFLRLAKAREFTLTAHAHDRLEEHLGFRPTRALAHCCFGRARQMRIEALRMLGYRPAFEARARRGEPSWYFRFRVFGEELIAVITPGKAPGSYVWVTVYAVNAQVDRYRWAAPATPGNATCEVSLAATAA